MSVADPVPLAGSSPVEPVRPAPPTDAAAPVPSPYGPVPRAGWTAVARTAPDGRPGRALEQVLAGAFALAWLTCPLVEPMPAHDMAYPLWQLPFDIAAVVTIVLAVAALWRGSRYAARFGIAAAGCMAVMTILCPLAGHTPVGWWTWVQTGMSLFVLGASTVLATRRPAAG
ncbi:7TM diverse intracellular signaling domain-containing protein [Blastococcus xanthinilyticus]|nr:7TM diverse intracellular signaling domain-containing protein [Blastococcus xanthinilyticus]